MLAGPEAAHGQASSNPERRFRGTMIGLAPPTPEPRAVPASPAATANHPQSPDLARGGNLHKTMLGLAPLGPNGQMPAIARASDPREGASYPTPPPPPEVPQARPLGAGGTLPQVSPHQKTMLGIARPGIAPLNPTQPKQPAGYASPVPEPRLQLQRAPTNAPEAPPLTSRPRLADPAQTNIALPSAKSGIPALAAVAIIGAGALFAAALVVWLFYHGHGAIEAHASALGDGSEQLELNCAACEEATQVRLDAASARFKSQRAVLPLSRPLKVGENAMTLALVSPRGKQSFVDISVPVAFRVWGDTSGLDGPRPELRVLVNALPGSTVSVDGKPLALNDAGEGRYIIDVSAEVTGLDASVKTLERRVPYVITPPRGAAESGVVSLQAGITPLVIDAPGPNVVLEGSNFVLAGRTAKSGALTVSDRPITVDPTGRFAQMMNVSAQGETTITIRASNKDSAPRLFPLRVKRVDSLAHEAERVRQRATSSYAVIAEQPDEKRGWAVALDGSVVDARTENYNTVIVMEVTGGCTRPPCLARVTYGAPLSLSPGEKLSAFGSLAGVVDGPRSGTRIPEIHADFLIKGSK